MVSDLRLSTEAGRERAPALLAVCVQRAGLCWGPLPEGVTLRKAARVHTKSDNSIHHSQVLLSVFILVS